MAALFIFLRQQNAAVESREDFLMRCRYGFVYNPSMLRDAENSQPQPSTLPLWQRMALLCLGYFVCAWLGRSISPAGGTAVSYWLPGGLFVAVLLANPTRDWPWLMASILPANIGFDLIHDPEPNWRLITGFCTANLAQAGVGAVLVRKFIAESPRLNSLKEFFGLLFFAGVIGPALGATIGATMLVRLGFAASFADTWEIFWGGNLMAVLVLSPLVLVFGSRAMRRAVATEWTLLQALELLLIVVGMVSFLWFVLVEGRGIGSPKIPVLVFTMWAGLRFGLPGAAVIIFGQAIASAFFTAQFLKGVSVPELASGSYIFTLQIFVAVSAMVTFVPTIVLAQRNRAVRELLESQQRFRQLNDAAFEGIAISEGGRVLDVNDQCARMLGWTRSEMIGRPLLDFIAPESRAAAAQAIAAQREATIEHRLLRRDGSMFDAEVQARVVHTAGRVVGMTAVRDITARRQAELALRASEESLRATIENTPNVAVQWFDREGRVKYWNRASETIYGWTAAETEGRTLDELMFTREQAAAFKKILMEIEASGQPFGPVEFPFHRRDGQPGVVVSTLFQIRHPSGASQFACMDVDRTEQKFEEELNRTQLHALKMISSGQPFRQTLTALLRDIEAQSPAMQTSILLLDADGVHMRHGAAPSLPAEYVKLIDGVALGEAVGSCGTAAFRREPVYVENIAQDPLWAAYRGLALPHGLLACWSTPIFDEQKKVLGTFAIYYRQTRQPDEKHLRLIQMATHTAAICLLKHRAELDHQQAIEREQQARIEYTLRLIAAQEAERKRIAAEIHDSLGQNLLLIKNRALIALRDQHAATIHEQLAGISHLAQQCITEARQMSRELHPYQLEHLGLKRSLELLLENTVPAAGAMKLVWKFDDVSGIFSDASATNLYRIMQESLNNILKHSAAKNVSVRLERDLHELQLHITDDGCGFATGAKFSGMGLKNITERVRMLGGQLRVDSAPGHGTRLEIAIPLAEAAQISSGV